MRPMSGAEVAVAVGGTLVNMSPEARITGVATDSRRVQSGDLFVAIPGERADGHDFAEMAVRSGAVGILSSRDTAEPAIRVDDTTLALGRLAAQVRIELSDCLVIGLTGSSGKTSTKDLIAQVLETAGPTIAAHGSFNTEVGVPMTILRADESTRFLVLEMGMRGLGHIRYLCDMARPNIVVLLNIGSAHLGMLGSREAIASAKGEILDGVSPGGCAVLNVDDPRVMGQADRARSAGARIVTFGSSLNSDVRAVDMRLDAQACGRFTLRWQDQSVPVALRLPGQHMIANALAAAAVGLEAGVNLDAVAAALRVAAPRSPMRMELREGDRGVLVVNDAYNANPESMQAALRAMVTMAAGRRTWAVLGEMRELGATSAHEHRQIGRLVANLGVDHLVCVGSAAEPILEGAREVSGWHGEARGVPTAAEAADIVVSEALATDVVLVKASRSIGLESVVAALMPSQAGES